MPEFVYRTRWSRRQGQGKNFHILPEAGVIESEDRTLRWTVTGRMGQPGGPSFSNVDMFARLTREAIKRLDVNDAGNIFLRTEIQDTAHRVVRIVFRMEPV